MVQISAQPQNTQPFEIQALIFLSAIWMYRNKLQRGFYKCLFILCAFDVFFMVQSGSLTAFVSGLWPPAETFIPRIIGRLLRAPLQHKDLLTELRVGSAHEMKTINVKALPSIINTAESHNASMRGL